MQHGAPSCDLGAGADLSPRSEPPFDIAFAVPEFASALDPTWTFAPVAPRVDRGLGSLQVFGQLIGREESFHSTLPFANQRTHRLDHVGVIRQTGVLVITGVESAATLRA